MSLGDVFGAVFTVVRDVFGDDFADVFEEAWFWGVVVRTSLPSSEGSQISLGMSLGPGSTPK